MDSMKGVSASHAGAAGRQASQNDSPEQLLDIFKAAALSVTKLYKTSALAESKARNDGYQDCLDDLLAFLDKESIGLDDGEGWRIRRWATKRLDGREGRLQSVESDEETDKAETTSAAELSRTTEDATPNAQPRTTPASPTVVPISETEEPLVPKPIVVPVQDHFTFQSSHSYPNIATLDLSDTRAHEGSSHSTSRTGKPRRTGARNSSNLGRTAGSKRKMDFSEFFDGYLNSKDPFGGGGSKRSRHI